MIGAITGSPPKLKNIYYIFYIWIKCRILWYLFKVYFTSIILNYHLICQTVFIAAMSIGTCFASSIFRIVRWDFGWLVLCSNFREFNAVASSDESCKVFCENVVREDLGNAAGWLHQLLCFFFEFYPVISVTWATVKYMWFILDDELKERTLFYKFWSFFVFSRESSNVHRFCWVHPHI